MNKELTLGSLFDGSGGFPLAAIFCEIKPIWSSEVEPFPIIVTQKNLPQVKHLGDIKDIKGLKLNLLILFPLVVLARIYLLLVKGQDSKEKNPTFFMRP